VRWSSWACIFVKWMGVHAAFRNNRSSERRQKEERLKGKQKTRSSISLLNESFKSQMKAFGTWRDSGGFFSDSGETILYFFHVSNTSDQILLLNPRFNGARWLPLRGESQSDVSVIVPPGAQCSAASTGKRRLTKRFAQKVKRQQ